MMLHIGNYVCSMGETVSPDRKAIYESSMRKTGGKMNAACMFWDSNGNKTLSYNPESKELEKP